VESFRRHVDGQPWCIPVLSCIGVDDANLARSCSDNVASSGCALQMYACPDEGVVIPVLQELK